MNIKPIVIGGVLALCLSAYSCTQFEADLCTSAQAIPGSGVHLNANQQLALTGLLNACAETSNGTQISSTTVARAIIDNAILLQQSGLLSHATIKAQAPEGQRVLERIKVRWELLARDGKL